MHHVLSLFSSILLLGGLTAAVPVAVEEQCVSQTICVDAVNPCGIKYGGCYDVCAVSARPIPPPCPSTTTKKPPVPTSTKKVITKVTTKKPTPTSTKKATTKVTTKKPTPTTTKKPVTTKIVTITKKITTSTSTKRDSTTGTKCSATVSVCWDGINSCGMMYGGCFPDCKPWPTFVPPPCPTKATLTAFPTDVITRVTTLPVLTLLDE